MKWMAFKFDWKFLLPLLVAILGVLAPMAWNSYGESNSLSLQVKLLSLTALEPDPQTSLTGLTVSIDGVPLATPYLAVLQIINSGTKPISSGLFEEPIKISAGKQVEVVRVQVTEASPIDLKAKVAFDEAGISIAPLLLNPNDSITIAVVTSNAKPSFTPTARIAGIQRISEIDASIKSSKVSLFGIVPFAGGALLMWASFVLVSAVFRPLSLGEYKFTMLVTSGVAGLLVGGGLTQLGLGGYSLLVTGIIIFVGCGLLVFNLARVEWPKSMDRILKEMEAKGKG